MKGRLMVGIWTLGCVGAGGEEREEPKLATRFTWPVDDREGYGTFGYDHLEPTDDRRWHAGQDLGLAGEADLGLPFVAVANAQVVLAKLNGGAWGHHIKIKHRLPDGTIVCSHYAHCDEIFVTEGEPVVIGQEIGTIGETGNAFGPHLHFEILSDCSANNPLFPTIAPIQRVAQYLHPSLFIADRQNILEISADPEQSYFGWGLTCFQVQSPVPSASMFFVAEGEEVDRAEAVSRGWVNEWLYVWQPSIESGRWLSDPIKEERTFTPESRYCLFVSFPSSGATVNFFLPAYYLVRERAEEELIRVARNNALYRDVNLASFRLENLQVGGWPSFDRYVLNLSHPLRADLPANQETLIHATYLPEPSWRWFSSMWLIDDGEEYYTDWLPFETTVPY